MKSSGKVCCSIHRAVVLDRDGVINDNRDFVNKPEDMHLYPYAADAIRLLNENGFRVYVATNQGGVGRGFLTEEALKAIHYKMVESLNQAGAQIDDIAYCAHSPEAQCNCRKPRPGMLFALHEKHLFDLENSFMVGDRETDVEAGMRAGMKTIRIGSNRTQANYSCKNLLEAAKYIIGLSETPPVL